MAEEYNVTFSKSFVGFAESVAIINGITSAMPEKLARQTRAILWAFVKRGVPAKIVLEALGEANMEGGFNDG